MIVKVNAKDLYKITPAFTSEAMCEIFEARLAPEQNIFAKYKVGAGFFQWSFPGEGWTRLSEADSIESAEVLGRMTEIKAEIAPALASVPKMNLDSIFTTPGKDYVFYKYDQDGKIRLMLAAWDYKFPVKQLTGPVVVGGAMVPVMRNVVLAFTEAGVPASGRQVLIKTFSGRNKKVVTDNDGLFQMGNLRVGKEYLIVVPEARKEVTIIPEKDREEYQIDLTQDYAVEIKAKLDGHSYPGLDVHLEVSGTTRSGVTDASGNVSFCIPYEEGAVAEIRAGVQVHSLPLSYPHTDLNLEFVSERTKLTVMVRKNGVPYPDAPVHISYGTYEKDYNAGADGVVSDSLVYKGGSLLAVTVLGDKQERIVRTDENVFEFDILEDKFQDVNILVLSGDNNVVPDYPLLVDIGGDSYSGSTDAEGYFRLGRHQVNRQIKVTDANDYNNTRDYQIEVGESLYKFYVNDAEEPKLLFSAYDSNGVPLAGRVINLSQDDKAATLYLDEAGKATLFRDVFKCGQNIDASLLENGVHRSDFQFALVPDEYEYRLEFSETIGRDWRKLILSVMFGILLLAIVLGVWALLMMLTL